MRHEAVPAQIPDKDTNEYASLQFGEQIETLVSRSSSASDGLKGRRFALRRLPSFGARIRKDVFTPQLAIPSPDDGGALMPKPWPILAATRPKSTIAALRWKVQLR